VLALAGESGGAVTSQIVAMIILLVVVVILQEFVIAWLLDALETTRSGVGRTRKEDKRGV
jgi:hypothetical protein